MEAEQRPETWVDGYPITHPKKKAFLLAYSRVGTQSKAAEIAGITRKTHHDWMNREHDEREAYRAAFAEAEEHSIEALENELYRRAMAGSSDQSSMTGIIFALKAKRPNVYRENLRVQHQDIPGGEIDLSKWSDEDLVTFKALISKVQTGGA
jgi:hypothetical protein